MKNKLGRFDQVTVRDIASAMEKALQAVAAEYGVAISRGNGRFDSAELKVGFVVRITDQSGTPTISPTAQSYANAIGARDFFGRKFTLDEWEYTVTDFKPKSKRYPVLCTRSDGKRFKFAIETVRRHVAIAVSS
jgi:hypothetical protein